MANVDIPSAKLVLLKNAASCKKGDSVGITGILKKYNPNNNIAVIHYDGFEAEVDTSKLVQDVPAKGDVLQCLGEVIEEATFGILRIQARIIRQVNTLHLDLYEKTVELRDTII
ncbi:unnamed protein product [Mucor hiemalis]